MKKISLPICGLLVLNGVTILGNAITEVAIPWLILEISNSPVLVAAVMSAKIIPIISSTFFGAQIVDILGRFRTSIVSDSVNFLSVLLIPIFYSADMLTFTLLAILIAISTLLDTPGRLAKDVVLIKEIVANRYDNQLINGMNATIENICDLLGPVFAALIIAAFGTISALYFDAITFLVAAFGLCVLKKYFQANIDTVSRVSMGSWTYFVEGVKYLKKQRTLLSVLLISATVNIVITPFLFVYLPYVNKTVFDSVISFGLSMACFGAGTSFSSLLYGFYAKHFTNKQTLLTGYISLVVALISLPLFHSQILFFIQLFTIGLCVGFAGPIDVTLIQNRCPKIFLDEL